MADQGDRNPDKNKVDKENFIYPVSSYYGPFSPSNLAFNANLQEFAQKVEIICGLETGGKISANDAYDQIKDLWKQLKQSKRNLLDTPEPPIDLPPE